MNLWWHSTPQTRNLPSSWPQKEKKIVTEEVAKVGASVVAQLVKKKNPPAVQETQDRFLGREDNLEKGEATHANIHGLPW